MIKRFKPGKKKCAVCPEYFEKNVHRALQEVCSPACAYKLVKLRQEKKEKKAWQEQKKVMQEDLKKYSAWLNDLETVINKISSLIDWGLPCISCGGYGKPQAGHYHSVASDSSIRFNLHNIHRQDYYCNVQKSSNTIGYDEGLIKIYGHQYWEYVKFGIKNEYHQPLKPQIFEIKEKIAICRNIIRDLEKNKTERSPEERIQLRNRYNLTIGLYLKNFTFC